MVNFIDSTRFPESVSEGASGGPRFNTGVFEGHTGIEQRNVMWRTPRHYYNVGLAIRTAADMRTVRNFFYQLRGRDVGFRYKDWNDFEIVTGNIGTGDGTTTVYNVVKKYTSGALTYSRRIFKIVAGSYTVYVNGVAQVDTVDYNIDIDTGIITFTAPPTNTHAITITCEFDVPVRLDVEAMVAGHVGYNAEDWKSIALIEVLYTADEFANAT